MGTSVPAFGSGHQTHVLQLRPSRVQVLQDRSCVALGCGTRNADVGERPRRRHAFLSCLYSSLSLRVGCLKPAKEE